MLNFLPKICLQYNLPDSLNNIPTVNKSNRDGFKKFPDGFYKFSDRIKLFPRQFRNIDSF